MAMWVFKTILCIVRMIDRLPALKMDSEAADKPGGTWAFPLWRKHYEMLLLYLIDFPVFSPDMLQWGQSPFLPCSILVPQSLTWQLAKRRPLIRLFVEWWNKVVNSPVCTQWKFSNGVHMHWRCLTAVCQTGYVATCLEITSTGGQTQMRMPVLPVNSLVTPVEWLNSAKPQLFHLHDHSGSIYLLGLLWTLCGIILVNWLEWCLTLSKHSIIMSWEGRTLLKDAFL